MAKISTEIIEQIPVLYSKMQNKSKVAKELGISPSTVSKYLKIFESNLNSIVIEEEDEELSIEDFKYFDRDELTKAINEGKTNLFKPYFHQITPEVAAIANELYDTYANLTTVGKIMGYGAATIKKHLNESTTLLKQKENEDKDALWYYIARLFGNHDENPVSEWNVIQMIKFRKLGYTYRGQLLTLKYIYEVLKLPIEKAHGSIGLIPYKYEESKLYYTKMQHKKEEILDGIIRQLEKDRIEIPYKPNYNTHRKRKRKEIDMSKLGEIE